MEVPNCLRFSCLSALLLAALLRSHVEASSLPVEEERRQDFVKYAHSKSRRELQALDPAYVALPGDCAGNNIDMTTGATLEICKQKCNAISSCTGFSWDPFAPKCHSKAASCSNPVPNTGWTFYTKVLCVAPTVSNAAQGGACSEGSIFSSGSSCTAQCAAGYTPSSASLFCSGSTLSPSTFQCQPNACAAPTAVGNQAQGGACSEGSSINSGSSCTAQCATGYSPSSALLSCTAGTLSPSTFQCQPNACAAPKVSDQAQGGACSEGSSINSGSSCTAQCVTGHSPSSASLSCSAGVLSPSTFECRPDVCQAPNVANQAQVGACSEGSSVSSGSSCTAQCAAGYTPSSASLSCSGGTLSPSTFQCQPNACAAPTVIGYQAQGGACSEGSSINSGSSCTAQCATGYSPSSALLSCSAGTLRPSIFECRPNACAAPKVSNQATGGACSEGSIINSSSSCTSQCEDGYEPSTASLSCNAGTLYPSKFKCEIIPAPVAAVVEEKDDGVPVWAAILIALAVLLLCCLLLLILFFCRKKPDKNEMAVQVVIVDDPIPTTEAGVGTIIPEKTTAEIATETSEVLPEVDNSATKIDNEGMRAYDEYAQLNIQLSISGGGPTIQDCNAVDVKC